MKLKVASKLERRSRSQLVRLLIEDYLADLEKSGVTWEDEGEER
jgi:metal-responsive CopG/Arc/MetJ family transcriptional regulator